MESDRDIELDQASRSQKAEALAPTITLPQGGTISADGGSVEFDAPSGTASYRLPLHLTPARALTPALMLTYNPGRGNGVFGRGFDIDLMRVRRRLRPVAPGETALDRYELSSGDELVPRYQEIAPGDWRPDTRMQSSSVDGVPVEFRVTAYRQRYESGFARIEHWIEPGGESHWRIVDRDNTVTLLGIDPLGRIADPDRPQDIVEWCLQETVDALGNRIRYEYKAEDDIGVPQTPGNQGRDHRSNRYIERIRYGNFIDDEGNEAFAFAVLFDYGQYNLAALDSDPDLRPTQPWVARPDPFSTYRPGFEVRTYRRCRAVLMVHTLPEELGVETCLVDALHLQYADEADGSLLVDATRTGYRLMADASYATRDVPTTRMQYAAFAPHNPRHGELRSVDAHGFPGMLNGLYRLVDIYGEGIPGVLYADPDTRLYWPPLGGARYGAPVSLPQMPIEFDPANAQVALTDVTGSGTLDLMISGSGRSGFYANAGGGQWRPYRSFDRYPSLIADADTTLVDIDGDGLTDAYIPSTGTVRSFPSMGAAGFGPARAPLAPPGFPGKDTDSELGFIAFADVFGDGLPARVLFTSGLLRAWPNLGHGRFGDRVDFVGAPLLDDSLPVNRVLFAALTASGCVDMVAVGRDSVSIHVNACGNGFAAPIQVALPIRIEDNDDVFFADVFGNGGSCLVVSKPGETARHYWFDFSGPQRPRQMIGADSGMGQITGFGYRSSTDYYLAARVGGHPWATRLPLPVQVMAWMTIEDRITGARQQQVCEYRDGWFDPDERMFRGFGYTQSQDTQSFDDGVWLFPTAMRAALDTSVSSQQPLVEPAQACTWYDTGAFVEGPALAAQYASEYYLGDPPFALRLGPSVFELGAWSDDPRVRRQAALALSRMRLHQEVYAVDPSGMPAASPLQVQQNNYRVRLLQPPLAGHPAVFATVGHESISTEYDRAGGDARIAHSFVLDIDDYGNPLLTASVAYGRTVLPPEAPPRQQQLLASVQRAWPINTVDQDTYLIGLTGSSATYELSGLQPDRGLYFSFDGCRSQVAAALANPVAFGTPLPSNVLASRIAGAERTYYWDAARDRALPLGEAIDPPLVHHSEMAVFPQSFVDAIYDTAVVTPALLHERGGLIFDPGDATWWAPGQIYRYAGPVRLFVVESSIDPFAATTTYGYDPYLIAATTLTDALGQSIHASLDYQTARIASARDLNGMVSEVLYDPLCEVIAASSYDAMATVPTGNQPLADYRRMAQATTAEILADPAEYLQGASSFYSYDLFAWEREGQPPDSVALRRVDWYYNEDGQPAPSTRIRRRVEYVDGFSRSLGEFAATDAATLDAALLPPDAGDIVWLASSRSVYNERGEPVLQYLPCAQSSFRYSPPSGLHYRYSFDAMGRLIRTDTPKGFLRRTDYAPWSTVEWDEDDTVLESSYYRRHIIDGEALPPLQRQALEQAVLFANTPTTQVLNPGGMQIQLVQINRDPRLPDEDQRLVSTFWPDINQKQLQVADARFYDPAQPDQPTAYNFITVYDMRGEPVRTVGADAGTDQRLVDAVGSDIERWSALGQRLSARFDTLHREIERHVIDGGISRLSEQWVYGDDIHLRNVGSVVLVRDEAGERHAPRFDLNGDPELQTTRILADVRTPVNWQDPSTVALMPDVWTQAWRRNAQAEVEWERSADGSELTYGNHLNGWLARLDMLQPGESTQRAVMGSQNYDAAGARQSMRLANGVDTHFSYDPATQRTVGIRSTRDAGQQTLQDLTYVYDPVGNVTSESDGTQTVAYRGGLAIDPVRRFGYDAVYRLISATGRQTVADHPDRLQNYRRHYSYDLSGNLLRLQSVNADSSPGFTREFSVAAQSNRSVPADMLTGGKRPEDFFDAAGNLQSLLQPLPDPELSALDYDYRNTLNAATILPRIDGDDDQAHFLYDDSRQRRRKVVERRVSGGTRVEDTLYIGNVAIVRDHLRGVASEQETVTLRLVAGPQCVLVTRCVRAMSGGAESERTYRYQLDDHLGSVGLEVDETAAVITYEEYYPYGGSAVIGGTSAVEVERKRYRFSGKELDQATGLYYFGQRYFVPWMARWLTPDPAGPADGINLFQYAYDNPTTFIDPTGNNGVTPEERAAWLLRVDSQYRYLTPSEFQSNVVLSWDEHQEIHKNSLLFADESARFSPGVEKRLNDAFRSVDSLFFFNNPVLAEAWDDANSRITHPSKTLDLRHDYTLTRSHLNSVLSVDIPELDFSNFLSPFETHHSLLKSLHPELATTTEIMALSTRGSTSSGLVGQHEGLFHLLTAAQMGSTFATEVPAVSGLIKRSIADSLSLDITDTTALQTAGYGWLELEDRSKGGTVKLWSVKKPEASKLAKRQKTQTERVNKIIKRNRSTAPYIVFDTPLRTKLKSKAGKGKLVSKAGKSTFTFTFN